MTYGQSVASRCQIDIEKLNPRPHECFGVAGCVFVPLGELQSPVHYLTP